MTDVLLFVTSCYFHGATAKMRCFLERLYCLYDIRGGTNLMTDRGHRIREGSDLYAEGVTFGKILADW